MTYAATIGFFDGVHRGHQFLIEQLKRVAASRSQGSMVITFARHPRQVLHPDWQPQLLSTLKEKRERLLLTGIDRLEVLSFDEAMSQLSARDFMEQVLQHQLGVTTLLTGYDNRFGHRREEGFVDYVRYGLELGIEVLSAEPLAIEKSNVSSSRIRHLLLEGAVDETALCLGYHYQVSGRVVHGEQIGRRLGFPTANVQPDDPYKMIPRNGVYAVEVLMDGATPLPGMMNIGTRPTFDGHRTTLEVHLFDFKENLYDCPITVRFIARLRDEQSFADSEALVRQMRLDEEQAKQILMTI